MNKEEKRNKIIELCNPKPGFLLVDVIQKVQKFDEKGRPTTYDAFSKILKGEHDFKINNDAEFLVVYDGYIHDCYHIGIDDKGLPCILSWTEMEENGDFDIDLVHTDRISYILNINALHKSERVNIENTEK